MNDQNNNNRGLFASFAGLRAFAALRYREYRLLWISGSFGNISFWMDEVTRGWLIYELTDSAVQLGLVRGVQALVDAGVWDDPVLRQKYVKRYSEYDRQQKSNA